jgi:4-hydroxybenzoate polyprenyltransferase
MAIGGLLGIAAHFANVLPDREADRRHGMRSLPHLLGARPAGIAALTALATAGVLGIVGPDTISPIAIAGGAATVALLVAGIVVVVRDPSSRWLFRIIMTAALAAVVTLAGASGSIVAVG